VFITGESSGIGLALAHQAASNGVRVSILAQSISKLEEAKQAIRLSIGIDVAVFAADMKDYDAVLKAINEAEPIDVLIMNQGVFIPQELEKQGLDEIRFMMDVQRIWVSVFFFFFFFYQICGLGLIFANFGLLVMGVGVPVGC
jgi:3-dehydrosphinganine reductase